MIEYDSGRFGLHLAFRCKGSVFPKALVFALPCGSAAAVLHYLLDQSEALKNSFGMTDASSTAFGSFSFVLGFLIVFRAQLAYNRWWEGGSLLVQLRGVWFDSYSLLISYCNAGTEMTEKVKKFRFQLVRLYSLMYCCALAQVSPNSDEVAAVSLNTFELINLDGMNPESLQFLRTCPDMCEVTLQWIQRLVVESDEAKIIKIAPPILSRVYDELGNGIVNLNSARKIKDFPFPFPMAQMTVVMLGFHAISTPLVCAATVKTTVRAGLITFVVCFCFWSVLYIAMELEMPYGEDPNDLPLYDMAKDFNESLRMLLDPLAHQVPDFDWEKGNSALTAWDVDLDSDLSVTACSSMLSTQSQMRDKSKLRKCASAMRTHNRQRGSIAVTAGTDQPKLLRSLSTISSKEDSEDEDEDEEDSGPQQNLEVKGRTPDVVQPPSTPPPGSAAPEPTPKTTTTTSESSASSPGERNSSAKHPSNNLATPEEYGRSPPGSAVPANGDAGAGRAAAARARPPDVRNTPQPRGTHAQSAAGSWTPEGRNRPQPEVLRVRSAPNATGQFAPASIPGQYNVIRELA